MHDEELRDWLERPWNEEELSLNQLSHTSRTGVSKLALQAYLDGVYFEPVSLGGLGVRRENSTIEKRIRAYRIRIEGLGYGDLEDDLIF